MRVFRTKRELNSFSDNLRNNKHNCKIGFIPTMGALHNAHLSLVKQSKSNNDYTVVSIYVNPNQFNNANDLKAYPRMVEQDLEKLKTVLAEDDVVFIPNDEEVYPEKDTRIFDFGILDTVLEGKFRPGHFNGVAQVVSRLFDLVKPDRAYFGEKDFQQLAVIKMMTEKYMNNSSIEIIPVEIMREEDGLAMSSRNMRLSKAHREAAPIIYKVLTKLKKNKASVDFQIAINEAIKEINTMDCLQVEYLDIVKQATFEPVMNWNELGDKVACVAVFAGDVRLIDNIKL